MAGVYSFSRYQEGSSKFAPHGMTKLAVRKSLEAGWGIHALNPHPHLPRLITRASFETFIGFEDGWVACTGPKAKFHTASYPWSHFFVREGSVTKDVTESTIP
ncbi:uncharacterized protein ARMOST_19910 [Armillaria ostoyae]|uniref:Uncharacterized protein n=1 Tax=Armillaria ostoyae TaxID=47428 RepID=A0A284S5Z7_ARMOS|nr:uncharacterized protein ARMOST_19910 [Armillaria ostoyae]